MMRPPILRSSFFGPGRRWGGSGEPQRTIGACNQVLVTRMQSCGGSPGWRRHRSASGVESLPSHHDLGIRATSHNYQVKKEKPVTPDGPKNPGGPPFGGRKRLRASTNLRSF